MPHAQRQRELIASLHLEALFALGEIGAFAPGDPDPAASRRPAGCSEQGRLREILSTVGGIDCGDVPAGVQQSPAACRRAAENIETWLAFLPGDCVRAMVRGGWHWNT